MDSHRGVLAIILSLVILLGYQYFFIDPEKIKTEPGQEIQQEENNPSQTNVTPAAPPEIIPAIPVQPGRTGRDIAIETPLVSALISETGGGIKSFKLKKYNESLKADSGFKELITTSTPHELPLYFAWGLGQDGSAMVPVYQADGPPQQDAAGNIKLTMAAALPSGIDIIRTITFHPDSYLLDLDIKIRNRTEHQIQGTPALSVISKPFSTNANNRFVFNGPAIFLNNSLEEIKTKDLLEDGPQTLSGKIDWLAYEGTYFMCGMLPPDNMQNSAYIKALDQDRILSQLVGNTTVLQGGESKSYTYTSYFGPKKLAELRKSGANLDKIINFGWFDVMAKPTLYMLNYIYGYIHNYGWAIILVTIIIKALFWPIAHKGMKSMKTMQKLQPKMAKLREKYSNDKERLNQEMIQLYRTYKINPLGGCLPMLLQIPVFFALYRVLMQTIELRHAPFMLWITDLSAPDRLPVGFDIPHLGGIPVLTLLMGGSMFLQQKMTPTTGDPTQAKIMMFLPVVFTFMFINFASGLVLYWFVNNLLSIAQQYVINHSPD
jgi:YidC/Oxa1 family membrane protein insertase